MPETITFNLRKTAVERAFEIAGHGSCESVQDIRRQLLREGFSHNQIVGPTLIRQLLGISRKARAYE